MVFKELDMRKKLRKLLDFIIARLGEPSTWYGIKFILLLCGAKIGMDLDWGAASFIGPTIYGLVLILKADKKDV